MIQRFIFSLTVILLLVFVIHILLLKYVVFSSGSWDEVFQGKLILAYVINAVLAMGIFALLVKLKGKYSTQLGFLFLIGSALKFLVFFIVFYPSYKADGDIQKIEFAAFFIPYAACLIYETIQLSNWLNKLA